MVRNVQILSTATLFTLFSVQSLYWGMFVRSNDFMQIIHKNININFFKTIFTFSNVFHFISLQTFDHHCPWVMHTIFIYLLSINSCINHALHWWIARLIYMANKLIHFFYSCLITIIRPNVESIWLIYSFIFIYFLYASNRNFHFLLGEQLHWPAELQIFLFFSDIAVHSYDEHIFTLFVLCIKS